MTDFLEESPGVKSSTRLTIVQLAACVVLLSVATAIVAVWGIKTSSAVAAPIITALGVVILGLGVQLVGAISQRNKGVTDDATR